MTEEVTVRRDDLAALLRAGGDTWPDRIVDSVVRMREVLAPPQPTLAEKIADSFWGHSPAARKHLAGMCLPVVEAAVSAAADEAWNAALDAAVAMDPLLIGLHRAAERLRRPTEGSAP